MKNQTDLPYEKFLAYGAQNLTDAELLAIIIRTGTKGEDALALAKRVLEMNANRDGLLQLQHIHLEQLKSIKGIGEVKAVRIKCIAELSNRIAATHMRERVDFSRPELVADYYMERMRHLENEQVRMLLLDNKGRLIHDTVLSTGTVNFSVLSPRDMFIRALEYRAVYIMLLHNHPSGDPTPSKDDRAMTAKIKAAGSFLHIPLLDHIIIGDGRYVSFLEEKIL